MKRRHFLIQVGQFLLVYGLAFDCQQMVKAAPQNPAGNAKETLFKATLIPVYSEIRPFEPLPVVIELKNVSGTQQSLTTSWLSAFQVRLIGGDWREYSLPGSLASPPIPRKKDFASGATLAKSDTISVNHLGQHVFQAPGTYEIRGRYGGILSDVQTIIVKGPAAEEEAAFTFLKEHPLYHYFDGKSAWLYVNTPELADGETIETISKQLADFIQMWPKTRYADWARLGLLLVERSRPETNKETLKSVLKDLMLLAPRLQKPVSVRAWVNAGETALYIGDRSQAIICFAEASKISPQKSLNSEISALFQPLT